MSILYPPATKSEKRILIAIFSISTFLLLIIIGLYILVPRPIVGDALVNTPSGEPFEIPPSNISPYFHFKPVTFLFISLIVFGYSSLSLLKKRIDKLPGNLRTILTTLSVLTF